MFVVIMGIAGPAAADVLVSNLGQFRLNPTATERLAGQSYAMPFTTGSNSNGYVLDSISIDFANGSQLEGYPLGNPVGDPVYVYLYRDTGGGRPNHSSQVAVLTKAGTNFENPVAGVNKHLTARANNLCCQRPHVVLEPGTQYWVYIWAGSSVSLVSLSNTGSFEDAGGAAGWSIGDAGFIHPDGTTESGYTSTGSAAQIQVEGRVNSAVKVSITDGSGTEGTDETIDFVVSLSGLTTKIVKMWYSAADVSAEASSDFEYTGGWLTFQPGETEKTVSVPIFDDTVIEGNETFDLALTELTGATFASGGDNGVGTIINADPVDVSVTSATATEGVDETMEFVATLSRPTTGTLSVDYLTFDGTATAGVDYTETKGRLTFEPGETSKTILVPILDDTVNDDGETFNLLLTIVNGGGPYTIDSGHGLGTIYNTEDLTASFENIPQDHDGNNTFTFNVHFTRHVSATPAAMRDHAFTVTNGEVTAAAGVNSRDDHWVITVEPDGDDTVTITLPGNRECATQGAICSDEDNPVQLTNSPSATVARSTGTPLTASFSNVPDEHTGADFTFDLAFTDELIAGWKQIERAFVVSGGSIKKIWRKTKGSDLGWNVTVRPAGSDSLTITLRATAQCSSTGAVCTDDGRRLSNSPSATVAGTAEVVKTTPTVSIAGGSGKEGDDDAIDFTVTLGEGASGTVTVDYATSDGTATAGADYTATSGTLTIAEGNSSGTIQVSVIDDEHNEGSETFTVTLSNASSGELTDSSATGTITNHDALPKALIARFGRTAAVHIVDQVEERVNAPRAPGFDGRVAGRQIKRDMGQQFALNFLQQLGGGYGHQQGQPAGLRTAGGTNDPGFGNSGMTSVLGPQNAIGGAMGPSASMQGLHPDQSYDQGMGMGLGSDRLLQGSSFALNRATSNGGILSFWSRSAQSSFYGQDGALALNGDVRTSMFGADYSKGRMVTGVSLSHSRGLGRYAGVDSGQVNSAVTGLYPWIGYKASGSPSGPSPATALAA